ncbi:hypothetical protein ACFQZ4_16960 [Catellatospora coxensis]
MRRCAYRAVVADDTLTRRQADWLADAVARGARMRRSALDALIRVGDPRWHEHAESALRGAGRRPGCPARLPSSARRTSRCGRRCSAGWWTWPPRST